LEALRRSVSLSAAACLIEYVIHALRRNIAAKENKTYLCACRVLVDVIEKFKAWF
jgi:hypothetical protein